MEPLEATLPSPPWLKWEVTAEHLMELAIMWMLELNVFHRTQCRSQNDHLIGVWPAATDQIPIGTIVTVRVGHARLEGQSARGAKQT